MALEDEADLAAEIAAQEAARAAQAKRMKELRAQAAKPKRAAATSSSSTPTAESTHRRQPATAAREHSELATKRRKAVELDEEVESRRGSRRGSRAQSPVEAGISLSDDEGVVEVVERAKPEGKHPVAGVDDAEDEDYKPPAGRKRRCEGRVLPRVRSPGNVRLYDVGSLAHNDSTPDARRVLQLYQHRERHERRTKYSQVQ